MTSTQTAAAHDKAVEAEMERIVQEKQERLDADQLPIPEAMVNLDPDTMAQQIDGGLRAAARQFVDHLARLSYWVTLAKEQEVWKRIINPATKKPYGAWQTYIVDTFTAEGMGPVGELPKTERNALVKLLLDAGISQHGAALVAKTSVATANRIAAGKEPGVPPASDQTGTGSDRRSVPTRRRTKVEVITDDLGELAKAWKEKTADGGYKIGDDELREFTKTLKSYHDKTAAELARRTRERHPGSKKVAA